jgi:hypothetical protein
MSHERITVLGSNGSDCFHYRDYALQRKCEPRRDTLIPDPSESNLKEER